MIQASGTTSDGAKAAKTSLPDDAASEPAAKATARTKQDPPGGADAPSEAKIESATREELIRQAAYRRYQARDGAPGGEVQDWLDAEAEVNQSFVE